MGYVRAYPAELMKLVKEGIVNIKYKNRRYTNYVLAYRDSEELISNLKEFGEYGNEY
jgi:hypothetical protein